VLTSASNARAAVECRLPGGPGLRTVSLGAGFGPMMELVTGTSARPGERTAFDSSHPLNLREPRRARPGRHRMPPLRRSPPHQPAGPRSPARPPPSLPHARHLAVRAGNTAVQRQGLPDILAAERQARHLIRRRTIEQLIYSRIQAAAGQDDRAWKRRTLALIEAKPPASDRIERAGTVPGRGLPRSHHHHCRRPAPSRKSSLRVVGIAYGARP
jgi:hypothetical protein